MTMRFAKLGLRVTIASALLSICVQPALAAPTKAPKPITISSHVFKDDTSRLCMAREVLGKDVDKTLPKTLCDTRAGWESRGVTFLIK